MCIAIYGQDNDTKGSGVLGVPQYGVLQEAHARNYVIQGTEQHRLSTKGRRCGAGWDLIDPFYGH